MGPAQSPLWIIWREFRRRLLRNPLGAVFPEDVELPHALEIALGESTAELDGEALGETLDRAAAIRRAASALLLVLEDQPSDLEVRTHLKGVDSRRCGSTRGPDKAPNLVK